MSPISGPPLKDPLKGNARQAAHPLIGHRRASLSFGIMRHRGLVLFILPLNLPRSHLSSIAYSRGERIIGEFRTISSYYYSCHLSVHNDAGELRGGTETLVVVLH